MTEEEKKQRLAELRERMAAKKAAKAKEEAKEIHLKEIAQLQTDHQAAIVAVEEAKIAVVEQHKKELADARADADKVIE